MRPMRSLIAGLLIAFISAIASGCALSKHHKPVQTEECANAGCDRPFEELLAMIGPCPDLKSLPVGRKITLRDCFASALRKGRLKDDSIRIKTYDFNLGVAQAKLEEKSKLEREKLHLTLEVGIHDLILDVEVAYWQLVRTRGDYISRLDTLQALAEEEVNVQARYKEKLITRQEVDALEEARQLAEAERVSAFARMTEAERNLRRTAGLWPWDTTTLEPCEMPVLVPPVCDSRVDLHEARFYRPELLLARVNVELACDDLKNLKEEAARPLARMKVQRESAALREAEEVMVYDLQRSQSQVLQTWQSVEILQAREEAAKRVLVAVTEKWQSKEFGELKELLRAQTGLSTARRDTLTAVTEHQQARAEHLRRKGVLLKHHSICIEGRDHRPVPGD